MSRIEGDLHYSNNMISCKWYSKERVLLLATNVDDMSGVSNVMRQRNGSATKTTVSCSNTINLYNNRMLFYLIEVALVNIHTVYTKLGNDSNDISLLNFKTAVAKNLIGRYSNREKSFPSSRPSKQISHELSMPREVRSDMPEFREK